MNITQILSISDVRNTYTALRRVTSEKKQLEVELEVAKTRLDERKAQALSMIPADQAKNEQMRNAFMRNAIPDAFAEVDKLRERIERLDQTLAVLRLDAEEIRTIISYFTAGNIELVTDYAK